jgi:hypothetical protein
MLILLYSLHSDYVSADHIVDSAFGHICSIYNIWHALPLSTYCMYDSICILGNWDTYNRTYTHRLYWNTFTLLLSNYHVRKHRTVLNFAARKHTRILCVLR